MSVSKQDREVIRDLAKEIAEIAALPKQQETIALWKASNSLKPVRPMVMIDQIPWHEMEVDGELSLQTEDGFCRGLEGRLRRTLYSWRHMPVDMVVEPVIDIHKAITNTGFGVATIEETAVSDPRNSVVGHGYIAQITTDEDVEKILTPEVGLNEEEIAALDAEVLERKLTRARDRMAMAGAHYVVDSIGDIMPCIDDINARMARGERP